MPSSPSRSWRSLTARSAAPDSTAISTTVMTLFFWNGSTRLSGTYPEMFRMGSSVTAGRSAAAFSPAGLGAPVAEEPGAAPLTRAVS